MRATAVIAAAALSLMLVACSQGTEPDAAAPAEAPTAAPAATPVMPADAPPQEEAAPAQADQTSCALDQGSDGAMELVRRCMAVSPATHPPCNPNNPCELIQGEIDRACGQYGPNETKPAECTA